MPLAHYFFSSMKTPINPPFPDAFFSTYQPTYLLFLTTGTQSILYNSFPLYFVFTRSMSRLRWECMTGSSFHSEVRIQIWASGHGCHWTVASSWTWVSQANLLVTSHSADPAPNKSSSKYQKKLLKGRPCPLHLSFLAKTSLKAGNIVVIT